jgi:heterodisulfide reductase subunit C
MLSEVIKELLWAAYASDIDEAEVATSGRQCGVSTASCSRAISHAFNYNDHEQIARTVYTARCYNMTISV